MKFSIITCTWNSAATLAETINSVQAQHDVDIEHIFVDGGSTDGTLELIKETCPGATVLQGVRGGISRAMNAGIEAASGDLIAHLHSDDYYASPQALTTVNQAFDSSPGAMWAVGRINVLRDGQLVEVARANRSLSASSFVQGAVSIPHPAVFARKALFAELGSFNEGLKYAMDIDLWLRFLPRYQPLLLDKVLAVFREHEGSVSTANVLAARLEERGVRRKSFWNHPLDNFIYELRFQRRFRRLQKQLQRS